MLVQLSQLRLLVFAADESTHEHDGNNDEDEHDPRHEHAKRALSEKRFVAEGLESLNREARGRVIHDDW